MDYGDCQYSTKRLRGESEPILSRMEERYTYPPMASLEMTRLEGTLFADQSQIDGHS